MKVVINNCYGGFGLSSKAQERYWGLKGKQVFFYESEYGTKKARKVSADVNPLLVHALFKDYGPLVDLAEVPREEFAKREIERIQTWLDAEKESAGKDVSFFETALYGYFRALQAEGALGNKKSLKLPHGTLQMRKKQAKLERDDEKLMKIARPLGLIKVKESLDWAEFKKRLVVDGFKVIDKETGEVLEGITVIEPESDEFSVKVD